MNYLNVKLRMLRLYLSGVLTKLRQEAQFHKNASLWFVFSKTGLLAVDKTGSKDLDDMRRSLEYVGVKYEMLSAPSLRARYPSMSFDDSFSAVLDPTAGILLADKCLAALQV